MAASAGKVLPTVWSSYFAWADWRQRGTGRFISDHLGRRGSGLVVELEGGDSAQWWRRLRLNPAAVVIVSSEFPDLPPKDGGLLRRVVGAAEKMPIGSANADVVICSEVLEHNLSPKLVLFESARLLRPGGLMLVTTPDGDAVLSYKFPVLGRKDFEELEKRSGHVSRVRKSDVTLWASEAGLSLSGDTWFHRKPLGALWWEVFTWLGLKGRRRLRALVQMVWPVVGLADLWLSRREGLWMGLAFVKRQSTCVDPTAGATQRQLVRSSEGQS